MLGEKDIYHIKELFYHQRLLVERLRREVFQHADPSSPSAPFDELQDAEETLAKIENQLTAIQINDPDSGLLVEISPGDAPSLVLGAETTGLSTRVHLRMAQAPTSFYHLLDPEINPLVSCTVNNHSESIRRLRVTSFIEGYSARAVTTVELAPGESYEFTHLPTLFTDQIRHLHELTRASLNLLIEDLDSELVESHSTHPIWLLARTTAPLGVRDPKDGSWQDLTPYLGAFVTPNAPSLMAFLRAAAEMHPQKRLTGYQGNKAQVEPQVKAVFQALKTRAEITYVNSVIAHSPEGGAANQRVRLPRESLEHRQTNCIDGAVLFASLLEGISLSPAIVVVPGHAFLAWETWSGAPDEWQYLETTMTGSHSFEEARASGEASAARYQALKEATGNPDSFRLLPLRTLRAERGIMPME